MKQKKYWLLALDLVFILSGLAFGQDARYSLSFRTYLYEASGPGRPFEWPEAQSDIILFLENSDGRIQNAEDIQKVFSLSGLRLIEESINEIKVRSEEILRLRLSQAFELNGNEYSLRLIPAETTPKADFNSFRVEIFKNAGPAGPQGLAHQKLITAKEICFTHGREPLLGFLFKDNTYFLSINLLAGYGAGISPPPIVKVGG